MPTAQPTQRSNFLRAAIVPGFLALLASSAPAQQEAPPSINLPYVFDSGWVQNNRSAPQVVISFPVFMEGAEWLRLYFDDVTLSGDLALSEGSILRLTALKDGAIQEMNSMHVSQWENSSCYFNGDTVLVEVLAQPGSGWNRVAMSSIDMGLIYTPQETICGPTDDRVLSSDPRAARLLPIGCTGWMINDCGRCFLTAGHCSGGVSVAQFNVPLSNSNGSLNHPPPSDQYAADPTSIISNGGQGVGNDWAYFGAFPNSNTGLTPAAAQGSVYELVNPPPASGTDIRITGYGVDGGNRNQTQQTDVGPAASITTTTVRYVTDTRGGNSGSPVIWEQTGQAIGIHTHGGCTSGGGSNVGTASSHNGLQNALANPQGVCEAGWTIPSDFPTLVAPGVPIPLQVNVIGGANFVTLHYRTAPGTFQTQFMVDLGGGTYEGTLPPMVCGDEPDYYFSYIDDSCGFTVFPEGAPTEFLSMEVGIEFPVFVDQFEADTGWTTSIAGATSGAWERGVPVNDPAWPHDPLSDSDGSGSCYLTENALGNTDVDNGSVSLISPVLDFTQPGTFVSYDYYHKITTGFGNDNLRVTARNGNGAWVTMVTHGSNGGLNWRSNRLTAQDFSDRGITATNDVQLRFTVTDAGTQTVNEGGLDNFFVGALGCDNGGTGTNYCVSGANGAQIEASGSASVSANDVVLHATSVPQNVNGMFFYGDLQTSSPFGNGTLCVAGSSGIFRLLPAVNSGVSGSVSRPLDLTSPPLPAGQITAGTSWNFQFWFRDGGASDLTDGLQIQFLP